MSSALMCLIRAKNLCAVEALLLDDARERAELQRAPHALCTAVRMRDAALVALLLRCGADVDAPHRSCTPLQIAVDVGDAAVVAALLGRAASLDVVVAGSPLPPPLHVAVTRRRVDLLRVLLAQQQRQCDVNVRTGASHSTPLHAVAQLEWRSDDDDSDEATLLALGDALLSAGADVNARESDGMTPLAWAVRQGCAALVRRLLRAGADVAARSTTSCLTPLMRASRSAIVAALLDAGADVAARDSDGWTPLFWAVLGAASDGRHGDVCRALQLLVEAGADVDAPTTADRFTPLRRATHWNVVGVVRLLLALGASASAVDAHGTPLLGEARLETVGAMLVACGAAREQWPSARLLPLTDETLGAARRALARQRVDLIRERAATICIALQALQLPALVLLLIVDCACASAPRVPLVTRWQLVTAIKHYAPAQLS